MPVHADPMFVFHRIRGEIQRLVYLPEMRDDITTFMKAISIMEQRAIDAYAKFNIKPETKAQRILNINRALAAAGREAFAAGINWDSGPYAKGSNEYSVWQAAWQGAWHRAQVQSQTQPVQSIPETSSGNSGEGT